MRLYEIGREGGLLLDAIRRSRRREYREPGLHVSTICDDIAKRLEPKKYSREIDEKNIFAFQELGNALEDVLASQLAARIPGWVKPKPRQDRDGVWGSPDGWDARTRTIHEVKATWVSEGVPERKPFVVVDRRGRIVEESHKFFRYRIQGTKYADMWNADRVRFHILFVNGNYRPPFPNFRTLTLVLKQSDKRDVSAMLRQHAIDQKWLKAA